MRKTFLMLAILCCMWGGTLAQAQALEGTQSNKPKSANTAQTDVNPSDPKDKPMKNEFSSRKAKRAKHHDQKNRAHQSDPRPDPEAPQNRVEYGGGGY